MWTLFMFFSEGIMIIMNIMNAFLTYEQSRKKNGVVFLTFLISILSYFVYSKTGVRYHYWKHFFLIGERMTFMIGMMRDSVTFIHHAFVMMITLKMKSWAWFPRDGTFLFRIIFHKWWIRLWVYNKFYNILKR